ncbi:MAG: hypothetical protein AB1486_13375 [Planctomycetota bacterium]
MPGLPGIGNGIYPGAFDSMRAADIDSDGSIEVVFGNFDGFVEVLEQRFVGSDSQVVFVPEYRSPPLGSGISALDVGSLDGVQKHIICGSSVGKIHRIRVNGPDSYSYVEQPFTTQTLSRGFISWLVIGEFHYGTSGKEVLIQNEESEWLLFNKNGSLMAKTSRVPDPNAADPLDVDNFTGPCGKPVAVFWPPAEPTDSQIAFLPGMDGFLRQLWYFPGPPAKLKVQIVSDYLGGAGRCAYFWDPAGTPAPVIIVGCRQGDGHALWMVDPSLPVGQRLIASIDQVIDGNKAIPLGEAVTIEKFATNEILVVHGPNLTRVGLTGDPRGFSDQPAPPAPVNVEIEGIGTEEELPESEYFGVSPEIGGVERYGSGSQTRYVVTTPAGRVWVLNNVLGYTRYTDTLYLPDNSDRLHWYSNRSLGHLSTIDEDPVAPGTLWVSEATNTYRRDQLACRRRVSPRGKSACFLCKRSNVRRRRTLEP